MELFILFTQCYHKSERGVTNRFLEAPFRVSVKLLQLTPTRGLKFLHLGNHLQLDSERELKS